MKIFNLEISKCIFAIGIITVFSTSCDVGKDEPGYSYLPDMIHSRAYETYSTNPNFSDSMTMRVPVEGTIPREMIPYPYEKGDKDMKLAGKTFSNPLESTSSVIQEGQMLYKRFCIQCHGDQGRGKGFLITSGKYKVPPRDLTSEKIRNRKDGEIYHVITVGYGVMGAHGPLIQQNDRWKIIHYIREELHNKDF